MDLKFKIGTTDQVNNEAKEPGSFLIDKEKGQILIDTNENKRINISGGDIDTSNLQEKFAEVSKSPQYTQLTVDTGFGISIQNPNFGWEFTTSDGHQFSAHPGNEVISIGYRAEPIRFTGVATPTDNNDAANKAYVDQEIATFDFIKVVDTLPEEGLENRIYFVPKVSEDKEQNNDLFDEYVWMAGTKIAEGPGHTSGGSVELNNFLIFEGVNECSITTLDLIHPYAAVAILTSDGGVHIVASYAENGWHPLYDCVIKETTLSVHRKWHDADREEDIDSGIESFEIVEGSLIVGVATSWEEGNNYVVTQGHRGWEWITTKQMEIDLDNYATKDYVDTKFTDINLALDEII